MWLSRLSLTNYRNLRRLSLDLTPGLTLFCGRNGHGQTNLLESVHVLATTRAAGLIGQLPVVFFSPADVALAGGPPAGRRQYLNVANSQVSNSYLRNLQRYARVLQQRNQLLRQVRERRQPLSAVEPWTDQLVEAGRHVLAQRLS